MFSRILSSVAGSALRSSTSLNKKSSRLSGVNVFMFFAGFRRFRRFRKFIRFIRFREFREFRGFRGFRDLWVNSFE